MKTGMKVESGKQVNSDQRMKVRSSIRAGAGNFGGDGTDVFEDVEFRPVGGKTVNHCESMKVRSKVKAGLWSAFWGGSTDAVQGAPAGDKAINHNESLKVRSNVRAGYKGGGGQDYGLR